MAIAEQFMATRTLTETLIKGLSAEDMSLQSMEDASPIKWHLAHVSWFFETFLLTPFHKNYQVKNNDYAKIFNSYYLQLGTPFTRAQRSLLSRPSLQEVLEYRKAIESDMLTLLETANEEITHLTLLGIAHEQQHQELICTDLLHALWQNPLRPQAYQAIKTPTPNPTKADWHPIKGGLCEIGAAQGFFFDNEQPRHKVFLEDFRLRTTPTSNAEFQAFIEDGGYEDSRLWLSDGWDKSRQENWQAPLYWEKRDNEYWHFTLYGMKRVEPTAPLCHISFYEADAFAKWAGKRLPSEFEWEHAAQSADKEKGQMLDAKAQILPHPPTGAGLSGLFGHIWEWSQSAYSPYPNYQASPSAIGEYNGKFMSGQMVMKGGSCATPKGHIRPSYRNFFPAHARWQFSGLRLAEGASP